MDSRSPVASGVGGKPMKRSNGTVWPPIFVSPMRGSSGRCSLPRSSSGSQRSTKGVRNVRCGAFGHPKPKSVVRTVWPSSASRIFCLYAGCAYASGSGNQSRPNHDGLRTQRQRSHEAAGVRDPSSGRNGDRRLPHRRHAARVPPCLLPPQDARRPRLPARRRRQLPLVPPAAHPRPSRPDRSRSRRRRAPARHMASDRPRKLTGQALAPPGIRPRSRQSKTAGAAR